MNDRSIMFDMSKTVAVVVVAEWNAIARREHSSHQYVGLNVFTAERVHVAITIQAEM